MLRAMLFDLDGVITDTARYHYRAWQQTAKTIGITLDETVNEALKGRSRMDSLAVILAFGHREHDFTAAAQAALAAQKNAAYVALLQDMGPQDLLPGMAAFLAATKAAGYKLALASASQNAPMILKRLALEDVFDAIVDPATLHHGKPAPEIFLRAAAMLEVAPQDAVGLEDAEAGIQAINAAGAFSVGIGSATALAQAALTFSTTQEVALPAIERAFATA